MGENARFKKGHKYRYIHAAPPNCHSKPLTSTICKYTVYFLVKLRGENSPLHLDGRKRAFEKRTRACRNARFKSAALARRKMSEASLSIGKLRVGAFENARDEKMPLNIRMQWNAGTTCVSERVLKTLACRGLRVGPSKLSEQKQWNHCKPRKQGGSAHACAHTDTHTHTHPPTHTHTHTHTTTQRTPRY